LVFTRGRSSAAVGGGANASQVIVAAIGKEFAGEDFDDDFRREEFSDLVAERSRFDGVDVAFRSG
jgi:hypothetical protein